MKEQLTLVDYRAAAATLKCEVAAVRAVSEVEAPRGGFLLTGVPVILFERHLFSRLTNRRFDKAAPDISNSTPGGYAGGLAEHFRLAKAVSLDRDAGLKATSWGKFQILGMNYQRAGFRSLQDFINAMFDSERKHLDAFVSFIQGDRRLVTALRTRDFASFARIYNGPAFAKNQYDQKMRDAYRRFSNER